MASNYTSEFSFYNGKRWARGYVEAWVHSETDTTATIYWRILCQQKSAALYGQEANGYVDGSYVGYASGYLSSSNSYWTDVCSNSGYVTVNKTSGARNVPVTISTRVTIIDGIGSVTTDWYSATCYVPVSGITAYAPNAPSGLTNTRESDTKNTLAWSAPSTDATHPVTAILIERSVDGGAWSQIESVSATATSYADTTTSADHYYRYRIRSQNSAGASSYATSGYTYNTPAAPTKVTASRLAETTVKLAIENAARTATALDVQRSTDGEEWQDVSSPQGSPVTEMTDTPGGGTFYYRARNTRDELASAWSPASNAVVTITPPNAPTLKNPASGSIVKKSAESITFKWAHNPIDGSSQTAAQLAYSTDGGNTWTTVSVTTAQYKTIANGFAINDEVTWRVRTKGAHEDYGPWSSTRVFRVYQEPSVAFTAPSDGFTIENTPIHVALQYDDPSGTLANASLSIAEGAKVVYTRDMGTDTACDIQATEWLPDDGVEYTLTVYVRSSSSLTASAIRVVSVDFDLPTPAVLGITPDPETGYVSLLVDVPSRFSDASGNPVHVTDALEGAKVEKLTINGNSYQEGEPSPDSPAPITMLGARNLLPYPYDQTTKTQNGITFTDNGDGAVTVSGTATADAYLYTTISKAFDSGDYVISGCPSGGGYSTYEIHVALGGSVACRDHGSGAALSLAEAVSNLSVAILVRSGATVSNLTFNPMIRPAACEDDEWVPYGKVKVEARGKNLYPSSNSADSSNVAGWQNDPIVQDGEWLKLTGNRKTPGFNFKGVMTFEAGKTYVVSFDAKASVECSFTYNYIMGTDSGNIQLSSLMTYGNIACSTTEKRLSFKFTPTVTYTGNLMVGLNGRTAGEVFWIKNLQVELDEVTDYVPYHAPLTALIDMQGEEVRALPDGTRDELTVDGEGNVSLVRRVGKVVFDGSEDEVWETRETSEAYRFITYVNDIKPVANDNDMPVGICDRLQPKTRNQTWSSISGFSYGTGTGLYICVSSISTVEDFTAWLADNPVTVYYPLRSAEVIPLGTVELSDLPAPDFTMQAEASLPAALDLTYTNGMEEAASVAVWREHGVQRVLLADGLQAGAGLVDRYAPVNVDYRYVVVSVADSGAVSTTYVPARIDSQWFYFIWGENVAKGRANPEGTKKLTRPNRRRRHLAGRQSPVSFDDGSVNDTRSVSVLLRTKAEADAFDQMMWESARCVYKSADGDVLHADVELSDKPAWTMPTYYGSVSVSLTRIDGRAL